MSNKIQTKVVTITPSWAKDVLERMNAKIETGEFRQRRLSKRTINKFASDMANGKWGLSHQSLGFYEGGDLYDGQHRLWAVIKSGASVKMMVTTGMPRSTRAMENSDTGKSRTISESLQVSYGFGFNESKVMATTTRYIAEFCTKVSFTYSLNQCLQMMDLYKAHINSISQFCPSAQRHSMPILAVMAFFHASNPKEASGFAESFYELEGLENGDPPLMLNRYFVNQIGTRGGGAKARNSIKAAAHMIYHYTKGNKVGKAVPSLESLEWMLDLQPANVKKVVQIIAPTDSDLEM